MQDKGGEGASVAPRSLPSSEEKPDVSETHCPTWPREISSAQLRSAPLTPHPCTATWTLTQFLGHRQGAQARLEGCLGLSEALPAQRWPWNVIPNWLWLRPEHVWESLGSSG